MSAGFLDLSKDHTKLEAQGLESASSSANGSVQVHFSKPALESFVAVLNDTLLQKKSELKVMLPQGWSLFFKTKPGAMRFMMARPQDTAWVGSVSVSEELLDSVFAQLHSLKEGKVTVLSWKSFGVVHVLSNFELSFSLLS